MVSSFNIGSPTVGGGTAFNAILNDWLSLLSQDARGRADVGLGLFGGLLESELSARRRPVSLLDQLLLSQEFGTVLPLSQLPPERSRRFGIRPAGDLRSLFDILMEFASGAVPGDGVAQGEGNQPRDDAFAAIRANPDLFAGDLIGGPNVSPRALQAGGSITVVPGQRRTRGNQVAGPVRIIDRTGKAVAVAGEGDRPETIRVTPQGRATGRASVSTGTTEAPDIQNLVDLFGQIDPETGQVVTITTIGEAVKALKGGEAFAPEGLSREVRFRLQDLLSRHPGLSQYQALIGAMNPGGVEEALGGRTDVRTQLSRALGGALSADLRFSDPFVRALALGRAPTPSELTARDVSTLPRSLRDRLAEVVGEDLFPDFLFELGMLSPTGTQVRQGTVAGLRV